MPDSYAASCATQVKIGGAEVRNVTRISRNYSATLRRLGTSTTDCTKIAVPGTVEGTVSFSVAITQEEFLEDIIAINDSITLEEIYRLEDGTVLKTVSMPLVVSGISDDVDISEGNEVIISVEAASNGAMTIT